MRIIHDIDDVCLLITQAKSAGQIVGLVPTMGALHDGHASLIDQAREECDVVVVSVFVNPTQFGPAEDLAAYPRPFEADCAVCEAHGVDAVFNPDVETMYGDGALTDVSVRELTETMCGRDRPVHFGGVCTVVAKLFNICPAQKAYFGAKDYQQSAVIRRMVADLNIPIEIVVCPTVREADGVAMSSRNAYLSPAERTQAAALHGSLQMAAEMIRTSRPPAADVIAAIREHLATHAPAGQIDYIQIVNPQTLADVEHTDQPLVLALAVRFGKARLIDNLSVDAAVSDA
ncbi:MAG: pantoate--beta-alanine ligase [Planctomycetota bacterium]|jgi:pantoate--beta-alanine ligase